MIPTKVVVPKHGVSHDKGRWKPVIATIQRWCQH
nr:MAG TPA: hypothetical protein [Caudoviricetes sp.]